MFNHISLLLTSQEASSSLGFDLKGSGGGPYSLKTELPPCPWYSWAGRAPGKQVTLYKNILRLREVMYSFPVVDNWPEENVCGARVQLSL